MAFSSPTDAYTATDLVAAIPEVWTSIINEAKFPNLTILNFVTDLSPFAGEGDIFHVPDLYTNTFSAGTQSTQANAVVDASVATVDTTLTVSNHKYVAFIMGDKDMKQMRKSMGIHEAYSRQAAALLLQTMEDALFALWSSVTTNTVGDTATVLTDLEIRSSINKLDSTSYELGQSAFFFHPTVYWTQIVPIQKFYDRSMNGMAPSVVSSGAFGTNMSDSSAYRGTLYGIPIWVSSRVVSGLQTYRNLLLHKSAFGIAIQTLGGSRIRTQSDYVLMNLGLLTVVDCIYGVAVLREPAAVLVNANTTATTA